jgi:MoaA/NifB/PqqE/SkfB family radical SAM enzyme
MIDNLSGVNRIILSGGEPTLRKDLVEILAYLQSMKFPVVAMATNATRITKELAANLAPVLTYADVTIDGAPANHNLIRGQFENVLRGIHNLIDEGVDVSLVNVLLSDNKSDVLEVCQMADDLGAKKLKILSPITKGRGTSVISHGLTSPELSEIYELIKQTKAARGWQVKITITDWNIVDEGHAVLVHPDGDIVASPVPSQQACILKFGNILQEHMRDAWKRYPYRENHVRKYLEDSLLVC